MAWGWTLLWIVIGYVGLYFIIRLIIGLSRKINKNPYASEYYGR